MRGPPDNKQDGPSATEGPPQVVPPGTVAILPDQGDPRRIGELLGDWLAIRMAEVDALIDEAFAATGASGPGDVGKVMGFVMGKAKGKVDGTAVQARVRARLGG